MARVSYTVIDSFIGLFDRATKRCVVYIVENRTKDTLLPLILRHVRPGSTIYSDMWRSYFCLTDYGYDHHMLNHSVEFVAPDGAHTQNIEHQWGELKAELKIMRGTREGMLSSHLDEFVCRRSAPRGTDFFDHYLQSISRVFKVNDP